MKESLLTTIETATTGELALLGIICVFTSAAIFLLIQTFVISKKIKDID